jgi:hypothetical protein
MDFDAPTLGKFRDRFVSEISTEYDQRSRSQFYLGLMNNKFNSVHSAWTTKFLQDHNVSFPVAVE